MPVVANVTAEYKESVAHEIARVRHELRWRSVGIRRTEYLTPCMIRLTLAGDELTGFTSLGADDHIKIATPGKDGSIDKRDYTPRRYDAAANELIVDVAVHEAGPATTWARNAKPGDVVQIGGPRGSAIVAHDFDWWLLIGDETALPAIGRWIEELPAGTPVTSIVSVTGPEEEQTFETRANHRAVWVHRPPTQADNPAPLLDALEHHAWPAGDGFVWIAAERGVARALRAHVLEVRRHPSAWLKAASYWARGKPDAGQKIDP
jgi:NADPH-dependent ferric siderophore reductase